MLDLPQEIIKKISLSLDQKSQSKLVRVSHFFNNTIGLNVQAAKLLNYVAHGMQAKAKALIIQNPEILCEYQTVTDMAGRRFKHVTALQLACWNLDQRMWSMILECASCGTKKKEILNALKGQLREQLVKGLQYEYQAETQCVSYFVFDAFEEAFKQFVNGRYQNQQYKKLCALQKDWPTNLIEELAQPNQKIYFEARKISEQYFRFEIKQDDQFARLLESDLQERAIIFDKTKKYLRYRFSYLIRAGEEKVVNFVCARTQSNLGFRRCKETDYMKHDVTAIKNYYFPGRIKALNNLAERLGIKNLRLNLDNIKTKYIQR